MLRNAAIVAVSSLLSACSVPALYPPWAQDDTCIDYAIRSLRAVVVGTETVKPAGLVYLIALPRLPSSTLPDLRTDRADIALFEDFGPNQELVFTIYLLGEPWSERSRPLFPVERRRLRRLVEQDCGGRWISPHAVQATLPRFVAEARPLDQTTSEDGILRLSETAFKDLPEPVRRFMRERDCLVPQPWDVRHPVNVLQGSFAAEGQTDWVLLCSNEGKSAIHIHWGGAAHCPEPIREEEDRFFVQSIPRGVGFSRQIIGLHPTEIASRYERIRRQPDAPAQLHTPGFDHLAIDDAFIPKASSTHYCEDGEWQRLLGSD